MLWKQVGEGAARCCHVLWGGGFEAYPVGGCVRDLLLGRVPGDWDVTTNALPEQVINLFERVVPTGVKHGTVTVILENETVEVTTFRGETGYSDGRHPDAVRFDAALEEDLARRDFTINAMALASDGSVIDRFGGQTDLKNGVIRCVGDPFRRFGEDGLRMFRAVRFGAQLGFVLSGETEDAIRACAGGAACVAAERVRVEVEKTLCSDRPELAAQFFALGLMARWARGCSADFSGLSALPAAPMLRWAGLCALLKPKSAGSFLRELKLDGATVRACEAGWTLWQSGLPENETDWRRALAGYGTDGCRAAAAMGRACGQGDVLAALERVLEQKPCVRVEQLALSGGQLARMGLRGAQIGQAQRYLLGCVLVRPEENRADVLRLKLQEFLAGS